MAKGDGKGSKRKPVEDGGSSETQTKKRGSSSNGSDSNGGKTKRSGVSGDGGSLPAGKSKINAQVGSENNRMNAVRGKGTGTSSGSQAQPLFMAAYTVNNSKVTAVPATITGNHGEEQEGKTDDDPSAITMTPSIFYHTTERDVEKEKKNRETALTEYVRHELFPYWKFFSSKQQLVFNPHPQSIVTKICSQLHVREEFRAAWWDENRDTVSKILSKRRSEVTSALKKSFISKC